MLKLRHLKINKYRNVRPGSELTFSDGHNILLGRNGTGKTTLLNLLSNLFRLPLGELCTEEMDIELELGFPGGRVTAAVKADVAEPLRSPLGDDGLPGLPHSRSREAHLRPVPPGAGRRRGRTPVGHMSEEEAEMFFSAYQVGLQQVGEILRTRGLW